MFQANNKIPMDTVKVYVGIFLYSDGEMATGWANDNGAWYFLYDNGSMAHNDTGKVINNWLYNEGNWYYLYPEGSMAKGWIEDGDSWYYLNNDGSMAYNTKIDGYYVNDDGEWKANKDFIEDNIMNKVTNGAAAKVTYNGNEAVEDDSVGEIITSFTGAVIRKFKDLNEFLRFELLMGLGEKNGGDIGVIYVTDEDEQLANVGADMLTGELAGNFVAIVANGVRAYKNIKTGEIVYNDAGNIKKAIGTAIEGVSNPNNFKIIKEISAEETNNWWKEVMNYDDPPYKPGIIVKEIELSEKTTFVRVYDGETSGMYGGWVMKAEDIEGLTPAQIQDKFALPSTPKYVADVNLDAKTHLRTGVVNPLEGWGKWRWNTI